MKQAFTLGLGIVFFVNIVSGIAGYFVYLDALKPNIIDNIKTQPGLVQYTIISIVLFNCLLSMPVTFFECRNNFLLLLDEIKPQQPPNQKALKQANSQSSITFYTATAILFLSIIYFGIVFPQVSTVFTFIGAVSCNTIGFIFPGLFVFIIYKKNSILSKERIGSLIVILVGILAMVFCVYLEVYRIVQREKQ